jgi:hypothetical protein
MALLYGTGNAETDDIDYRQPPDALRYLRVAISTTFLQILAQHNAGDPGHAAPVARWTYPQRLAGKGYEPLVTAVHTLRRSEPVGQDSAPVGRPVHCALRKPVGRNAADRPEWPGRGASPGDAGPRGKVGCPLACVVGKSAVRWPSRVREVCGVGTDVTSPDSSRSPSRTVGALKGHHHGGVGLSQEGADDHAERAVFVVLSDQYDRVSEVGIE